ncbi:MAG: integrase [Gemmatimonadota bacterium]|nr:integrase [Deltaproteobacteria bacterium]MDE2973670.1 integrase [Gemmatimonadota bacterium]
MAVMLSETYQAFIEAGASEEKAQAAAQEIANFEQRLVRIESKLNLLITLVVTILVFVLGAAATILFR